MRIDILTLFPAMFAPLGESIVKRAQEKGILELHITNIRDYTLDKHHTTDDRLYGGGAGMVMKPEPIFAAVRDCARAKKPRILLTSPQGRPFDQAMAETLAEEEQLILICGHYEGVDERVCLGLGAEPVSIGDFVLTGGELPAMAIADAVVRLLPGALGDDRSSDEESFSDGLLEYPQYTRPPLFEGMSVPEVLLSGNHADILKWRREQSLLRTYQRRPALLEAAPLTETDIRFLAELRRAEVQLFRLFVALLHYPVYNKKKQVINTSLTNLDLHDIARAACTFGVSGYHIIQPLPQQRELIQNLLDHWRNGFGADYNPHRKAALDIVSLSPSLEETVAAITTAYGPLKRIATSARDAEGIIGYREMRKTMENEGGNYLLLLGTGWGLTEEEMHTADFRLRPIYGTADYNHLSVRSAASIILDRLLGENNAR